MRRAQRSRGARSARTFLDWHAANQMPRAASPQLTDFGPLTGVVVRWDGWKGTIERLGFEFLLHAKFIEDGDAARLRVGDSVRFIPFLAETKAASATKGWQAHHVRKRTTG